MKIGIDARVFLGGHKTGVEEYAQRLLLSLFEQHPEHTYILFINALQYDDATLSWTQQFPHVRVKRFFFPNKLLNFLLWWLHYPRLDRLLGGVDVFFMPNHNFVAVSRETKLIVTLHDLSHEHYKRTFSWKRRLWHWFVNPRTLLRRADHIIAVSTATKQDACSFYQIPSTKITVASNGKTGIKGSVTRNDAIVHTVKEKYQLPYKFILSFSTIEPRKNIVNLITAFEHFRAMSQSAHYKLVIAGALGWHAKAIDRAINQSSYAHDIICITDIPEAEKEALYVLADLFVYPSYYEGFGFPPLEALLAGTPVLTSHTASLPEVVGKYAVMIDPYRPEEIAYAMREILTQRHAMRHTKDTLYQHMKKFSWLRAGNQLIMCAQKIHDGSMQS